MPGFLLVLCTSVAQDLWRRRLERTYIYVAGVMGILFCIFTVRNIFEVFGSVSIGVLLLLAYRVTGGKIGEGDGWFFIVTGLFLKPEENIVLFLSGVFFCSLFSLVVAAASFTGTGGVGKIRVPFLPFLLPMGLWIALL